MCVLGFNDTSTLVGHFVSSSREREKRGRRDSRGDERSSLFTLPASGHFCRLLILLANSLDQDQARQNVGPDLDPNCLTL